MPRGRSHSATPAGAASVSSSLHSRSAQGQTSQYSAASAPQPVETEEKLTRLEAHAAVRIDELSDKLFDCDDLPRRSSKTKRAKHRAFAQTVRKMASFLTTRINPSFQESQLRIEETAEGLYFAVYTTTTPPKVTLRARLSTLVDVVSDSVIEKETVVFTQAPGSEKETHTTSGASRSSAAHASPPNSGPSPTRKGELLSNLIRAYGDIGLLLTFKVSRRCAETPKRVRHHRKSVNSDASAVPRRPFTRISIRFVSTADRDEWLSFCTEAYVGLLVDSIRTGMDQAQRDEAARPHPVLSTKIAPPSRDAIDKYVEFFLSNGAGEDATTTETTLGADTNIDFRTAPGGGLITVSRIGEVGQLHRLTVDKRGRSHRDYLVMHRTSARQCWKGVKRFTAPVSTISVFADDEHTGTNFFVECDRGDKSTAVASQPSSATHVLWPRARVSTYELVAKSHASRALWLRWLEVVTGKPVVYFSQAQQEVGANAQDEERKAQLFRMDELW